MLSKISKRKLSLSNKILVNISALIIFVFVFSIGLTLNYSINIQSDKLNESILNLSYLISKNPMVSQTLSNGKENPSLTLFLDDMIKNFPSVDVIVVADTKSIRYYHPNHSKIGYTFEGNDEVNILKGMPPYVSTANGTLGMQKRAFSSVKNEQGTIIGFVVVGTLNTSLIKLRQDILMNYLKIFLIIITITLIIFIYIRKNIKKSLLGYEPAQLAKMYLQREDVLDSLEEGILAVDCDGKITLLNKAALPMLDLDTSPNHLKSIPTFIQNKLLQVIISGVAERNKEMLIGQINLIADYIPIKENNKIIGAISIFRNKTEVTELAEQLTGVHHIVDALRANTHEFMNKLHVILGLLQINAFDEAKNYIMDIANIQNITTSSIIKKIKNHTIAALILGKVNQAKELGISLILKPNSSLEANGLGISTHALVTIIGNLLQNSMDALNTKEDCLKEITLLIHADEKGLIIIVDDTGPGIAQNHLPFIYKEGYSSKGENRGIGLSLVKEIIDTHGGFIEIETEENVGTVFTVIVPNKQR
ncbi:MAG: ATP-binding protein [Cellulosilyticaceae bacterium]